MADENGNGRVTMAVIGTKLDYLITKVNDIEDCVTADHDRVGALEGEVKRIEGRVNGWAAAQSAFTTALSAIAAWLGMRS